MPTTADSSASATADAEAAPSLKDRLLALKDAPAIAHLMRALQRFSQRNGPQFAAGTAYFSMVAIVPVLLATCAILGMIVTVIRPDMLTTIEDWITTQLSGMEMAEQINGIVSNALLQWRSIGIVAIIMAIYAGSGWINNLAQAINGVWRRVFDLPDPAVFPLLRIGKNLLIFVAFAILVIATIATSAVGSLLGRIILDWLQFEGIWATIGLRAISLASTLLVGWVLFTFMYFTLSKQKVPFGNIARGALLGSTGLCVLQLLASEIMKSFSNNQTAAIFGPVIIVLLVLNIFAQIILFVAAWIATCPQPDDEPALVADPPPDFVPLTTRVDEEIDIVSPNDARRAASATMNLGYGVGLLTGLGAGGVAGGLMGRRKRRRR
ncbi:MAG: YihY/virulence factor BrkB family protein [Propionibacteriaceae bacterium]|jgi:membrane protein|nr:YihY/virulence factor BrkB family protein [Propionibacteriaceae bacterium]